jgi:20S proteasome alpha/beta subunit
MDSLIAIKGKDFIVMAADTVNAYSVLRMKVTPKSYLELR